MRFGMSLWGFLADRKMKDGVEVSTPDGNVTYSWSILHEAQQRGWETYLLQEDRDKEFVKSVYSFISFSPELRDDAYNNCHQTNGTDLPDLDVILIEWRWPIPGRNCEIGDDQDFQPDLERQTEILEHYKNKKTRIVIWDLDHKLTLEDEVKWSPDAIFETSVNPLDLGNK